MTHFAVVIRAVLLTITVFCTFDGTFKTEAFAQAGSDEGWINSEYLSSLMKWRNIGPARGGRSLAVAGSVTNSGLYFMGTTGGGIWKTADGGKTWKSVGESLTVGSIGDIDIAATDSNIVYAGTGEGCIRGNVSHGDGIYKSADGGKTWEHTGLTESRHIGRLMIHPQNPDIVFAAALGHVYAPPGGNRGEHGLFKTSDGGKTWRNVLPGTNDRTGAIDIEINHRNPDILFAALYETFRNSYTLSSGGSGSGLYKSVDGGETWTKISGGGFPEGILGKIGIAIAQSDPDRIYAIVEARNGGLYRSDDGGETWIQTNNDRDKRQRAWYYTHVTADPLDKDVVYVLNTRILKSTDGGETFTIIRPPHGDVHALWIDPNDSMRMITGNDGGANVSTDGGINWTGLQYPTAQFYHVFTDDDYPYNVYGAQQDNSTIKISSASALSDFNWHPVGGGESGHVVPHPLNSDIVFAGSYGGLITRYDHATRTTRNIHPWPDNPMGWGAADLKYRLQWTAPILVSKHDPTKLYHAGNVLFRSTNEGEDWEIVSPDLTRNDKNKQGPSGGPLTHDNTSVEYYNTIFALSESPMREGIIWAGTDDGRIHITRNGGDSWQDITPSRMPGWSLISSIEASHFNIGTAYSAVDRHELDDYGAYAYKTTDFGETWIEINKGFRENDFLRVIREDPAVPGILYAGTETGVYYSINGGESWNSFQLNLPTVPVHDLSVKRNDLVAGTHGRSFWILDDLTVLHQLRDKDIRTGTLLKPDDTFRWAGGGSNQISFQYFLESDQRNELSFDILEADGDVIKTITSGQEGNSLPDSVGWNNFEWDMRYADADSVPGHPMWAATKRGPVAVPGNYKAVLHTGQSSQNVEFEIKIDPRMSATRQQLQTQCDLLISIRNKVTLAHSTVNQLRRIKEDLEAMKEQSEQRDLTTAINNVYETLSAVEANILQVNSKSRQDPLNFPIKVNNKLAALTRVVSSSYYAPTKQSYDVYSMLADELDGYVERYRKALNEDIPALNERARRANLAPIDVMVRDR